jgi:hypothetical protein
MSNDSDSRTLNVGVRSQCMYHMQFVHRGLLHYAEDLSLVLIGWEGVVCCTVNHETSNQESSGYTYWE